MKRHTEAVEYSPKAPRRQVWIRVTDAELDALLQDAVSPGIKEQCQTLLRNPLQLQEEIDEPRDPR